MKQKTIKRLLCVIQFLFTFTLYPQRGSVLPYTGGPGPLFSFGLNVQPKNMIVYRQIYNVDERNLEPRLIIHNHLYYGLSDHFTLVIKQPVILKRRTNGKHSRGLGDIRIEIETIPYVFEVPNEYRFRITTVTGIIPPTTTIKAVTQLSLPSPSYFIGITQSNTTPRVFQYGGLGIFIPTTTKKKFFYGCRFYYELGFAHAIINNDAFYLGVDFEMSGEYQQAQRHRGRTNFNTGNNMIFFGPSFRVSTEHFIGQVGIQYPWVRHTKPLIPNPNATNYRFNVAGAFRYQF